MIKPIMRLTPEEVAEWKKNLEEISNRYQKHNYGRMPVAKRERKKGKSRIGRRRKRSV